MPEFSGQGRELRLLTVVMPVYNERGTLRASLERLLETELPVPVEVLVVDDGSTDGGPDTVSDLVGNGRVRLIRHARNLGKGAALRTGIARATGDVLTVLDADLEADPREYPIMLAPIRSGRARLVYGARSFGRRNGQPLSYAIGNKALCLWASLLFRSWVTDVETCFKMADVALWRSLRLSSDGFGIEAEATAKFLRSGERIHEVPIDYRARGRKEGKKIRWTDGVEAVWILLRVRLLGR